MANLPTPRSRSQILGSMLDALLSRLGLPTLQVGNPMLSILEAAAQSDLRSSQDIFNLLEAIRLDLATGDALRAIGESERVQIQEQKAATGFVTISDSTFTKLASSVFQGQPAPIVGSTVLYVADALNWPSTGSLYIGRGTTNYEGPLTYTAVVSSGGYWTITLSTPTTKYHNRGESVVLAQGGNRSVSAQTVVQTAQSNADEAVRFQTRYLVTLPDGENSIENVEVAALRSGPIGNAVPAAINTFAAPPFTGATVTNPVGFTNGLPTEDDNSYRERIRAARASRSRGTPLAIETAITGIESVGENKRVLAAKLVRRAGGNSTLYIDDGTGYEESTEGVGYESILEKALGGERYFQLVNGRPVSKAFCETTLSAPFSLVGGSYLSVRVGSELSEHVFSETDFRSINASSAYEVAASINQNSALRFYARTSASGLKVSLVSKVNENEDIEVVSPATGLVDSNFYLGFPSGKNDTLRLYKNDRLLNKDGKLATVESRSQGLWGATTSGDTLVILVDGVSVGTNSYAITNQDFVGAGTGFSSVASTNTLQAWADVLNYKIPGITATVTGGSITLTSNRGRSARARIQITGGTLVTKGLFAVSDSTGKDTDYILNRNLGEIELTDSLVAGDKLTAGSLATRAFLESNELTTLNLASDALLWFVVDGAAQIVSTNVAVGTSFQWVLSTTDAGTDIVRIVQPAALSMFANVQAGDYVVVNDSAVNAANRGAWRITTTTATEIRIERPTGVFVAQTVSLAESGLTIVRTETPPQLVTIPSGTNYTAASIAAAITLSGATASVYRTRSVRVRTNRFLAGGDIALVSQNAAAVALGFSFGSATINETSHLAAAESSKGVGTPRFGMSAINTVTSPTVFALTSSLGQFTSDAIITAAKQVTRSSVPRFSERFFSSTIDNINTLTLTARSSRPNTWLPVDRLFASSPFSVVGRDSLAVVLDGDEISKRYVMSMGRRVTPTSATYGITNTFTDTDNSGLSLAAAFGTGFDWQDFLVEMKARTKSNGTPDTASTMLWRYARPGLEGNRARLQYSYARAASQATTAVVNSTSSAYSEVQIQLPTGSLRTGVQTTSGTRLGIKTTSGPTAGLYTHTMVLNLPIATATRTIRLNYTAGSGTRTGSVTTTSATGTGAVDFGTYITMATTAGTFVNGEIITFGGGGTATVSGSQYAMVDATLTLPSGITNHGFSPGDYLYAALNGTGTGAGFLTGLKVIQETTATNVRYVEGTTAIGATASIGTISFDTAEARLGASTVAIGDVFNFQKTTSDPFGRALKILTLADGNWTAQSPTISSVGAGATLVWQPIENTTNLAFYPVSGSAITTMAAAINAQTDAQVSAVAVGDGAVNNGSITYATYEATPNGLGGTDPWYYFTDGAHWVRSHTTPPNTATNFTFTFKDTTAASLGANADWLNEEIRLVPITAKNVAGYLSVAAPGGLFSASEVAAVDSLNRVQIASTTVGSGGAVEVQGGSANSLTAALRGASSSVSGTHMVSTVLSSDAIGLAAGHWVRLANTRPATKIRITSATQLNTIDTDGRVSLGPTLIDYTGKAGGWNIGETVTSGAASGTVLYVVGGGSGGAAGTVAIRRTSTTLFTTGQPLTGSLGTTATSSSNEYQSGPKAWEWATTTPGVISGRTWQVEAQGDFVAFQYVSGTAVSFAGVVEGDLVHVAGTGINTRNTGLFRVVRIDDTSKTFWLENSNFTPESGAVCDLAFLKYDSIVPGDEISISTSLWGAGNLGVWTVKSIDLSTYSASNLNDQYVFTLETSSRTPQAIAGGTVAALGASSGAVVVREGLASSLIKRIHTISFNPSNTTYSDIKFDSAAGYDKASDTFGTVLTSLDKIGFSTTQAVGIDGYRHSVGLIEEANKVGYGDSQATTAYPGVIAAGDNIPIEGTVIRRATVSLAIRRRSGVSSVDIANAVRSAVSAAINKATSKDPVAISDVVSAANSVNGVIGVVVLSPAYTVDSDLLPAESFEKLFVLDPDQDILISFLE